MTIKLTKEQAEYLKMAIEDSIDSLDMSDGYEISQLNKILDQLEAKA